MEAETGSNMEGQEFEGERKITLQYWSREAASATEPGDSVLPMPCCRCGICNESFTSRNKVSEHIKIKHYKWVPGEFKLENLGGNGQECPISDLIELPSACGRASFFFPEFDDIDKFLRLSSAEAISHIGDQVLTSSVLNDENPTSRTIAVTQLVTGSDTSLTSAFSNGSHELRFSKLGDCTGIASFIVPKTVSSGDVSSCGTSKEDGGNCVDGTNDSTETSSSICRSDNRRHLPLPDYSISICDDIRYLCELCGSKYVSFGTCGLHMRTAHRRTPMLPAALQNSSMKQIEQVFLHDILHKFADKCTGNGPKCTFFCSLCGDSFLSLRHCSKHFKNEHKGMKECEQIDVNPLEENTLNGLPKVQQVKREEYERETTLDRLLKLTKLILARYEREEYADDGDDWDTDGQEIVDGLVEDAATCHLKNVQFSAEEDCGSRVMDGVDTSVLSGGKPEHDGGELSTEQTALIYGCFVCPERFPSFQDCGRHMISQHAGEEDKWGEVLGLHQMTLDQLKKMYRVPQQIKQNTDRGFGGEHVFKVCASRSDKRRQEGMSSHEEEGSKQLHGHAQDATDDREWRRQELHRENGKEVDNDVTQSEQPSPKKMKLRQNNCRSEGLKVSSLNQKVVPHDQRMQKVNQEQRKHKKQHHSHPKKALSFQCSECSEIFNSASELDKHIGRKHCGVSSLKCQKCARYASIPADEKYRSILEEITGAKEAILSRGFKKKGGAEKIQHYFECVVCGDGFRCRVHFDKHPSCHVEYDCQMCHQDFPSFTALSMHVHSHNCGPLPCKDCGKTFYNTKSWLDHVLQHNKQLQCDICHITFSNPQNLRRHNITKHHIGKKDSFECGECGKKFHFKYKYLLHIQNVHGLYDPDSSNNYLCDHCGVKLKSASYLRLHTLTHQDVFTCEDCGCWFKQQFQLDLHKERAHQNTTLITSEKPTSSQQKDNFHPTATTTETESVLQQPKKAKRHRKHKQNSGLTYKCSYCKTYFRSLKLKIGHERRHKGDAFQCGKCNTLLPSFEAYGKHLRNHHELPEQLFYQCSICPKRFQAPWQLERHSKRHRTCKKCGESFEKVDLLLEHLSTSDQCADHLSVGKFSKHMTERHQSKPRVSKRSKHSPIGSSPASPDVSSPPAVPVAAQENVPSKVSLHMLPVEGVESRKKVSDDDETTGFLISLAGIVGS